MPLAFRCCKLLVIEMWWPSYNHCFLRWRLPVRRSLIDLKAGHQTLEIARGVFISLQGILWPCLLDGWEDACDQRRVHQTQQIQDPDLKASREIETQRRSFSPVSIPKFKRKTEGKVMKHRINHLDMIKPSNTSEIF